MISAVFLQLDVGLLTRLSGLVIPLLVGLLAKAHASTKVKAWLNAFLSAIAGGITAAIAAKGRVEVSLIANGMLDTWVTSMAAYYGVWKPAGVAPAIQRATNNFGIGGAASGGGPDQQHPAVPYEVTPGRSTANTGGFIPPGTDGAIFFDLTPSHDPADDTDGVGSDESLARLHGGPNQMGVATPVSEPAKKKAAPRKKATAAKKAAAKKKA